MKTNKILLLALVAVSCVACSNDDDNNSINNNVAAELSGEYNLTSLYSPVATDYNQDGTASNDLMMESVCYLDTQITLSEDMTYTATNSYVFFLSETGCQSDERFGTWEVNGNTVILTDMTMNLPSEQNYTYDENHLYKVVENDQYPTRDDEGNPVYNFTELQYTFTKVN